MKLVVAVIRPERLEAVKEALAEVEVFRLTVADVESLESPPSVAPGGTSSPEPRLERRARVEVAVNEAFVEPTIGAIVRGGRAAGASAGQDGAVYVLPLTDVVRIRTGERGPDAI